MARNNLEERSELRGVHVLEDVLADSARGVYILHHHQMLHHHHDAAVGTLIVSPSESGGVVAPISRGWGNHSIVVNSDGPF